MSYHISTTLEDSFAGAIAKVKEALKQHGFGVLTEIDVQATLKEKIGADFRPYRILGACNPRMAHRALTAEDKIGTMLPCNVIVQEHAPGRIEVSAIDPVASMAAVENPRLREVAEEVRTLLAETIAALGRS
jgi:uncharacterized protein (DUF302 family)